MIGIIDYGAGNLKSVTHAFDVINVPVELCSSPDLLDKYERLILPGVGSFSWCFDNLESGGWIEPLNRKVLEEKSPILGICVGMQLMAERGLEGGEHRGFGWFPGDVVKIQTSSLDLKIPHIGWDNVSMLKSHDILKNIPDQSDFYFVHSYYMQCLNPEYVIASCEYGTPFPVAVAHKNIVGVQFHPEKSQTIGLQLIKNFSEWMPKC